MQERKEEKESEEKIGAGFAARKKKTFEKNLNANVSFVRCTVQHVHKKISAINLFEYFLVNAKSSVFFRSTHSGTLLANCTVPGNPE